MASEEVVVIRWPLHAGELLQNLSSMRDRGELNDVTLITPDGSAEAHRAILAASSELLREMLKKSAVYVPCTVLLKDITFVQLNLVLDFLYKGELAVLKSQLNDLAKACDYLQIKTCLSSLETADVTDAATLLFDDEGDESCRSIIGDVPGKSPRRSRKVVEDIPEERIEEKSPLESEAIEMEELQSSEDAFEVITFEDVEGGINEEVKPKTRQSYAKKARLSIVGDKRIYTLDDDNNVTDSPTQMGPDRRYCRECRITLGYPNEFREHRKQCHALQCAQCDFRATKESTIREHFEKVHENIRRFSCEACPFQCKDRATLLNHSRRHTNEKPYECGYCDYKSVQSASMKQHVTLHENVESRPFPCDECTRHPISFGSRAALTKHKKAHHTARVVALTIIQGDQPIAEHAPENS